MTDGADPPPTPPLVVEVAVRGFRSAREVVLAPGPMCALVGEARSGKSNLLAAIRAVLDPAVEVVPGDLAVDGDESLEIRAVLGSGATVELAGTPPHVARAASDDRPVVLFLPAHERSEGLVADASPTAPETAGVLKIFETALTERRAVDGHDSMASSALSLVDALQACCAFGVSGLVMLVEEPELYLRPQAQRYLYRLLRRFADGGNQVVYSTHSPAFLNVARLDELVFVERSPGSDTRALRPQPISPDKDFRVLTEFDAERAELFLARSAVLVEGQTEKLTLPFVFEALGHDPDLAGISIVECGGKSNIALFARICRAAGIPFVAIHDRDARADRAPSAPDRAIAASIRGLAGAEHTVELAPDFEAVAGMERHRRGKPQRAWRRFASLPAERMPSQLVQAAQLALDLADGRADALGRAGGESAAA